jgi:hypothetical protein
MRGEEVDRQPRGVAAGLIAGIIGIGCCVGPAVVALTGITSAAVAIDTANSLYSQWGWAFKLAGFGAGGVAIAFALGSRRRCRTRPLGISRYALIVVITGLATYGTLYGVTTWLGRIRDQSTGAAEQIVSPLPPVRVAGNSVSTRVHSALEEVASRYPTVELSLAGLSRDGVLVSIWWRLPEGSVGERYHAELSDTFEDSREATILLLQTIARTNPSIDELGAFEDRIIVPIWSKEQVLQAGDPADFREFARFSQFQRSARRQAGYFALFNAGDDR